MIRASAFLLLVVGAYPLEASASSPQEGWKALEEWQLEDAMAISEALLVEKPNGAERLRLAAEVQFHRGEFYAAWTLLEAALDMGAKRRPSDDLIRSTSRFGHAFQAIDTEHFRIRYLDKDEITATYAAEILEEVYQNIGKALDFYPAEEGERIAVEIYPDASGLSGATGLPVINIATSGTIAVCKFHRLMITSPLAVADGYGWADTIAHEYIHLVISKKSRNSVPIWLHEGIAKYFESAWRGKKGEALGPHYESLLAEAVKKGELITYDEMHPSMARLPSQEATALAFAEVFTTVEFIDKTMGGSKVPKVLAQLGKGRSLDAVLQGQLGHSMKSLEGAWKRYLRSRKFQTKAGAKPMPIVLTTPGAEPSERNAMETIDDANAQNFARLGEMLDMRGHTAASVLQYQKAFDRVKHRYPSLVYRLAKAYDVTGRTDEARKLLDQSFKTHPLENSPSDGRVLAARLAMKSEDDAAARKLYENLRFRNPFNPEIHMGLASIYERAKEKDRAQREKRFVALSSAPRPTNRHKKPGWEPSNSGGAFVPGYKSLRWDNGIVYATPTWGLPTNGEALEVEVVGAGDVAKLPPNAQAMRIVKP